MSRTTAITNLAKHFNRRFFVQRAQPLSSNYTTLSQPPIHSPSQKTDTTNLPKNPTVSPLQIGENVPRKDKITFLVSTLTDIDNTKENVYNTLDAWVAWERNFPIGSLKNVLLALEKEQQWHRMIQVIKWILSKGQGTTRGTYGQLIQALDMDNRVEEAHEIWKKKLGYDLHSVPWKLCKLMISVYHRNKMFDEVVKLFKGLEGFDRKPPEKSIVKKVADAYELLGLPDEKERVLEKYKDLFAESVNGKFKTMKRYASPKKIKQSRTG